MPSQLTISFTDLKRDNFSNNISDTRVRLELNTISQSLLIESSISGSTGTINGSPPANAQRRTPESIVLRLSMLC